MIIQTGEWDQGLYNKYIRENGVVVQKLDNDKFVNFVLTGWSNGNSILVHMNCVEGAYTKYFLARTVFGTFANLGYYRSKNFVFENCEPITQFGKRQ